MRPSAVTFDLDDTLAVVDRSRASLLAEATTRVGAPPISRSAYLEAHSSVWSSETREPIFDLLLDDSTGIDPAELASAYRTVIGEHLLPVPGVEAMLDTIGQGIPVGLITNGPTVAQLDKLSRLGWTDRFDTVVISGRLGTPKPRPEPFLAACDQLGVDRSSVLHVGDHRVHDILGGRRVGFETLHVVDELGETTSGPAVARDELATVLTNRLTPVRH